MTALGLTECGFPRSATKIDTIFSDLAISPPVLHRVSYSSGGSKQWNLLLKIVPEVDRSNALSLYNRFKVAEFQLCDLTMNDLRIVTAVTAIPTGKIENQRRS
jgi:hypothetical protein